MTTTGNTQRDEMARDIFFADHPKAPKGHLREEWEALGRSTQAGATYAHDIADGLIANGYGKQRTITTVKELDALPDRTAILTEQGDCFQADRRSNGSNWWSDPWSPRIRVSMDIALPATVLHDPEVEAAA